MLKILNAVSVISTFIFTFGLLFLVQKYTIGLLFRFNEHTLFGKFYTSDLVFSLTSFLIIFKLIDFFKPY
jgi:hypothetical protein